MKTKENCIIYPLGKSRHVVINPRRQFGAPTIDRPYVPTYCLYGMFTAGEPLKSLAEYFEVPVEKALQAIQYEAMIRCKHGRAAIKKSSEREPI